MAGSKSARRRPRVHPEPQKEDAFDALDEPESPDASSRDESFEIADLDDGSGSDEERLEEERREAERVGADLDVEDAIRAYQRALEGGGEGREAGSGSDEAEFGSVSDSSDVDDVDDVDDAASDSSEEERPQRNTVGAVPLSWYDDEQHIGYDQAGEQILKSRRKDKLDALLEKTDDPTAYRKVYDQYNDEEITLTKEEMRMIQNIRTGRFAHAESMELYPEENDWFSRHKEVMPLSAAPEPKRRFVPSKWEEKKVVKLVRAIRKGWLSTQAAPKAPTVYELWGQADGDGEGQKTLAGLTYLAAPKMVLPGHEESYNPPKEYLLTKEEEMQAKLEAEESELPPPFIPQAFDCLRKVPAYERFVKERFERCLDLYLCPRARVKRMEMRDPESLVPKLPKPKDLQPFPAILSVRYVGHKGKVTSLGVHPSGQWLVSGGKDGTMRLWEVRTGRCMQVFTFGEKGDVVQRVAWCPRRELGLVAVAVGKRVVLVPVKLSEAAYVAATEALEAVAGDGDSGDGGEEEEEGDAAAGKPATWALDKAVVTSSAGAPVPAVAIKHSFEVKDVSWHAAGDYFSSVCPKGNTKAVLVHQLSKGHSQNPFRKNKGIVARAMFHPTKPFFFVATQQAVRVYNLAKQSLAKKLVSGSGVITSMSIHPSGDHVILGGEDKRVCWFDLDLSVKPYKALRYHDAAVRGVAFHQTYPLFASASDDGTAHVFHGKVFSDLMTNPMIVPVKILKGHTKSKRGEGVSEVVFHPSQPWAFTGGADGNVHLYCNP